MKRGFQKFLLQNCFHNTKKMEKKRLDGVCIQHFFNLLFSKVKAFSKAIYDRDSREHQSFKRMFFPRFLTYNFSSSFLETDCMMCFLIKSGKKGKMKSGI